MRGESVFKLRCREKCFAACLTHLLQQLTGRKARFSRGQFFQSRDNRAGPERIGVAQRPAAKGREARAEHHREIDVGW